GGYGRTVIIRHLEGFHTVYAHNRELLVRKGEKVVRGQSIARSGQTGRATGPHLHFEIRRRVTPRDPLFFLP
ncbi:MAG: M23 family metallopeptidase, partial [Nitrospinota bacterium]